MRNSFTSTLSLIGPSGYVIIAAIILLLGIGIAVTLLASARYALLARELKRDIDLEQPFRQRVLNRIVQDAYEALRRTSREVNTQAIIENNFQAELGGLLLGERFVKATAGLMIIFGLVGTFYGLTTSISKLVDLVGGDASSAANITQSVIGGLTEALAGMSIAFSTSLFGIASAIVMTLMGVFFNLADRRTALMVQIELCLDNLLVHQMRGPEDAAQPAGHGDAGVGLATKKLEQILGNFGQSVAQLESVVGHFDAALKNFATTTRDFREFNLHLKDNIQRMSLGFGDLSETLKTQVNVMKSRDPR